MTCEKAKVLSSDSLCEDTNTHEEISMFQMIRGFLYQVTVTIMDIVFSLAILIFSAPLLISIAILIKNDSPGPVIFRHRRVGYNRRKKANSNIVNERRKQEGFGKPFTLYKFRTMYADARERYPELYEYNHTEEELRSLSINVLLGTKSGSSTMSESDDPRLTKIGKLLRRTSLDEFPNFINVLKGDMHLVGPRPDIHENILYYTKNQLKIFDVKPGITGLAQTQGRKLLSFYEINEFDIKYVENRCLLLDLKILFRTAIVCFLGDGAY